MRPPSRSLVWRCLAPLLWAIPALAQKAPDPPTIPAGVPDLLRTEGGEPVTTADQWRTSRRPELLRFFTRAMYGQSPGRPAAMTFAPEATPAETLDGKAVREQIAIRLDDKPNGRTIHLLVIRPKAATGRVPVILSANFAGNHAISDDPGILESPIPMPASGGKLAVAPRGSDGKRWPLATIIDRGYALATFARGDLDPDRKDGVDQSVRADYPDLQNRGDNFSVIAAWAWGMSRALDFLETHPDLDAKRVVGLGHSRLGKAALWAGATDDRFAVLISNESGAGGAKLFRRAVGEDINRLNTVFPHWFCTNFRQYNGQDATLPFDQHQVIALIAPRPVYVGSAQADRNADPEGEFAGVKLADPVYRLFGLPGLPASTWPAVGTPSMGTTGYHVRPGAHDVTPFDWACYLDFADRHLRAPGSP